MPEEEVIARAVALLQGPLKGLNITTVRKICSQLPKQFKEAQDKAIIAESLYLQGDLTTSEIAAHLGVARRTLYNYLHFRGVSFHKKNM